MTKNHTPTPWTAGHGICTTQPFIHCDATGDRVANCGPEDDNWIGWDQSAAEANTRLIVRSVNSHQALVDSCRALLAMVDEMLPKHGPCGWGTIETDNARAVLAAATEDKQ